MKAKDYRHTTRYLELAKPLKAIRYYIKKKNLVLWIMAN